MDNLFQVSKQVQKENSSTESRKPWRYYYAICFPLSKDVPKSQLDAMQSEAHRVETAEENFLQSIAKRNPYNKVEEDKSALAIASRRTLSRFNFWAVAFCASCIVLLVLFKNSEYGVLIHSNLYTTLFVVLGTITFVSMAGYVAAKFKSYRFVRMYILLLTVVLFAQVFITYLVSETKNTLVEMQGTEMANNNTKSFVTKFIDNDVVEGLKLTFDELYVDGKYNSTYYEKWFYTWVEDHCPSREKVAQKDEMLNATQTKTPRILFLQASIKHFNVKKTSPSSSSSSSSNSGQSTNNTESGSTNITTPKPKPKFGVESIIPQKILNSTLNPFRHRNSSEFGLPFFAPLHNTTVIPSKTSKFEECKKSISSQLIQIFQALYLISSLIVLFEVFSILTSITFYYSDANISRVRSEVKKRARIRERKREKQGKGFAARNRFRVLVFNATLAIVSCAVVALGGYTVYVNCANSFNGTLADWIVIGTLLVVGFVVFFTTAVGCCGGARSLVFSVALLGSGTYLLLTRGLNSTEMTDSTEWYFSAVLFGFGAGLMITSISGWRGTRLMSSRWMKLHLVLLIVWLLAFGYALFSIDNMAQVAQWISTSDKRRNSPSATTAVKTFHALFEYISQRPKSTLTSKKTSPTANIRSALNNAFEVWSKRNCKAPNPTLVSSSSSSSSVYMLLQSAFETAAQDLMGTSHTTHINQDPTETQLLRVLVETPQVRSAEINFETCRVAFGMAVHGALECVHYILLVFIILLGLALYRGAYFFFQLPRGRTKRSNKPLHQIHAERERHIEKQKAKERAERDKANDDLLRDCIPYHTAFKQFLCIVPAITVQLRTEKTLKCLFRRFWMKQVQLNGAVDDNEIEQIPRHQLGALFRKLIIHQLRYESKLHVTFTISKNGKMLICKLSATDDVLRDHAESTEYKLQMNRAIDPGHEFWRKRSELAQDRKMYEKATAKHKLSFLYLKKRIAKHEFRIFPSETAPQWSKRIHALERMSREPGIPITNEYAAFVPYVCSPELQYLFRKYRNKLDFPLEERDKDDADSDTQLYGEPSVLRTVDRIRLTCSLLQKEFNVGEMLREGVLVDALCLHQSSNYDLINRRNLFDMWITYWKPICLSGEAKGTNSCLIQSLRRIYPFRQPLLEIRDYYGEKVALYFFWLGNYAKNLLFPATLSIAYVLLTGSVHSMEAKDVEKLLVTTDDTFEGRLSMTCIGFFAILWIWMVRFTGAWNAVNKSQSLKWGMVGFESVERERSSFKGVLIRNPATNELELSFSVNIRRFRQFVSLCVIAGIIAAHIVVVLCIFQVQNYLVGTFGVLVGILLSTVLQTGVVQANSPIVMKVANFMNEWENYRTETEFEDGLILKVFLFQMFNNYSALLLTAFMKKPVFGCVKRNTDTPTAVPSVSANLQNEPGKGNCLQELEILLFMMFLTRMALNLVEVGSPLLKKWLATYQMNAKRKRILGTGGEQHKTSMNDGLSVDVEYEIALEQYENTIEDYCEMVIQFGLLALFFVVLPIVPILAFIECTIEIRVDAFKLVSFLRRPMPLGAEDIGVWQHYMVFVCRASIFTNLAILFFTADNFKGVSLHARIVAIVLVIVCLLAIDNILRVFLFPTITEEMNIALKRQKVVSDKYFRSIDDDSENSKSSPSASHTELDDSTNIARLIQQEISMQQREDNNHIVQSVSERMQLLGRFNQLYRPSRKYYKKLREKGSESGTSSRTPPTTTSLELARQRDSEQHGVASLNVEVNHNVDLEGMDAIREAVRRAHSAFQFDNDGDLLWPWNGDTFGESTRSISPQHSLGIPVRPVVRGMQSSPGENLTQQQQEEQKDSETRIEIAEELEISDEILDLL